MFKLKSNKFASNSYANLVPNTYLHKLLPKNIFSVFGGVGFTVVLLFCMVPVELLRSKLKKRHRELTEPLGYQIYLETLRPKQLAQASLLQKNQMFQNVFFDIFNAKN